jgi:hypothetical protein
VYLLCTVYCVVHSVYRVPCTVYRVLGPITPNNVAAQKGDGPRAAGRTGKQSAAAEALMATVTAGHAPIPTGNNVTLLGTEYEIRVVQGRVECTRVVLMRLLVRLATPTKDHNAQGQATHTSPPDQIALVDRYQTHTRRAGMRDGRLLFRCNFVKHDYI